MVKSFPKGHSDIACVAVFFFFLKIELVTIWFQDDLQKHKADIMLLGNECVRVS